jgi:hypothetical protein
MSGSVKLTGYDKRTEFMAVEFDVPSEAVKYAREIANVPETDPGILGAYPLSFDQAVLIARAALDRDVPDLSVYDFFLEAIEEGTTAPAPP